MNNEDRIRELEHKVLILEEEIKIRRSTRRVYHAFCGKDFYTAGLKDVVLSILEYLGLEIVYGSEGFVLEKHENN